MTPEVQTWIAIGIVFLTTLAFLVRFLKKKKNTNSCSNSCGCSAGSPLQKQSPSQKN
ncbi:MAG: FeoB-associated Cys-rich membrane protein [Chthoniobacterales bacterium]